MTTRLTTDIRASIATAVLRHRFESDIETLVADRAAFAEEVYNDLYRKADREKMASLPKGWLPEEQKIYARFGIGGNTYERVDFSGDVYGALSRYRKHDPKRESRSLRVLSKHSHGCAKVYEDTHKLSVRYRDLDDRMAALRSEIVTAERQVKAALAAVGTIKSLIAAWPEVEPFALKYEDAPRALPSVPTSQLNETLRLPVAA